MIGLAIIVIGSKTANFSLSLLLPPLLTAVGLVVLDNLGFLRRGLGRLAHSSTDAEPAWSLAPQVAGAGLPWSPFAILVLSRSVRDGWKPDGRPWLTGWLQVGLACLVGGTLVPGLSQAARVVALAGLIVVAAACLESAWTRSLAGSPRRAFFVVFGSVLGLWLAVMLYGIYIWNLVMPFYRPLGIIMSIMAIGVAVLGWSALETRNSRRGLGHVDGHRGRAEAGPLGLLCSRVELPLQPRPVGPRDRQWVPKRWTLYTFHDWAPDLAFFMKRPVRQLRSPNYLEYQSGPESKFVLLQASEFETGPSPLRRSLWSRSFWINRRKCASWLAPRAPCRLPGRIPESNLTRGTVSRPRTQRRR